MKNFIQYGQSMPYTASVAIASGQVVLVGSKIGVARTDIAIGNTGELAMDGVYRVAKKSSDTFAQGALLYWDDTNDYLTTTSAGNTLAGYSVSAAGPGVIITYIRINA